MIALLAGACATAGASVGARSTVGECSGLLDRRLETCTAYIANASLAARVPYYKLARSTNPAHARLARYRLESRYVGAARLAIERQTGRWPHGTAKVDVPRIAILSVRVTGNTAVLATRETWHVTSGSGRVLFAQTRKRHTVTMKRVPGVALHKWVVAAIRPL
ncbi:MAG TPA: hypothetical protein VJT84_06250 [Gaiellaceae bacterium]|nr:hypothetical protein [Gaiellaceae bacterium]